MADDYSSRQRKHATKIATERALMDTFGISRSKARELNEGLTKFQQQLTNKPEPEVLGPPAPPQFQISETKTERRGNVGRPRENGGGPALGGVAPGTPSGTPITIQAIVWTDSTTMSAQYISVQGTITTPP